jgi:uncharacterized protein
MANRLSAETSPYLLQHAGNPVDWYPWGPEAFARARDEDRPVLLSVGYSACHWCHVMERESFEDPSTAAVMNGLYVNVKVDREERPDVDAVYMAAVQQMTGHGGWPMTVFLTPGGEPFYGGTYYPPEPRHGMPSFVQLLEAVAVAWRDRRDEVARGAALLTGAVRAASELLSPPAALSTELLDRAWAGLAARFDPEDGGLRGAPKFPQPLLLELALRTWRRTGEPAALHAVETALRRMASGGIHDHLGGGFARYSVDSAWLVPHFEKMLYDNALLARLYLLAWQATGADEHRLVAEDTLGWIAREMRSPEGGFHSALDADSEGEEGRFYVWTPDEIDGVLGPDGGRIARAWWSVAPGGNFEGRSILHAGRSLDVVAEELGLPAAGVAGAVEDARRRLYEARARRVWPARDEKVLTAWNAMALRAFAEAARLLESADHLEVALRSARFLTTAMRVDGRLMRSWKDGSARIPAFLDDHALLADALVSVYEATGDPAWVLEARRTADETLDLFWDGEEGVFHDTAHDAERLVVRPRDPSDGATPSGTSSAVSMLLRLGELLGEERYRGIAVRVLERLAEPAARVPAAFGNLLGALDRHLARPTELAVVGDPGAAETRALLRVVSTRYLPDLVLAVSAPDAGGGAVGGDLVPLLRDRGTRDGAATAYLCERGVCRAPVTDPPALAALLDAASAG